MLELHALQQRRHELDMAAEGVSAVTTSAALPAGEEPVKGLPGSHSPSSDWQRVEELYDICERFKAPAAVLPSVLQRLKLLKGIHQEAGGVAVRLSGNFALILCTSSVLSTRDKRWSTFHKNVALPYNQ